MKVLALPRDPGPYQRLLYGACARRGLRVRYVGDLTPSRSLNLLLLPLELALWRIAGWRTLHLHWVFNFSLPGARRLPLMRRLARGWFGLILASARLLGMRVAWTAHNTLPHDPVFDDDVAARRALVNASRVVLAHSQSAVADLKRIGAQPRRVAVVPPGPFASNGAASALPEPGSARPGPLRLLFFGKVLPYKGVEELLRALALLPLAADVRLTVAGHCPDRDLRARIEELADERVQLRLEHVPDDEIAPLMAAADAVVLPFRRITTSSSALLAMEHGRPLVVPDLPLFNELPERAAVRYDGSVGGLAGALRELAGWDAGRLSAAGAAAREHTRSLSWDDAADRTVAVLSEVGS